MDFPEIQPDAPQPDAPRPDSPQPEAIPPGDVVAAPPLTFAEKHGISPLLFGGLSLAAVFVTYQIIGGTVTFLMFGAEPGPAQVQGYRLATALGELLLILVPTLIFARFVTFSPRPFLRLGFPGLRALLVPLVAVFSLQEMLQIYLVFQEKIPLPQELQELVEKFRQIVDELYRILLAAGSLPEFIWVVIVIAAVPALTEEFLFRGLIQRCFEKGLGPLWGIVLTGVIFAAYHLNPFAFVPLAVLGTYLGFLAYRANSIWVAVAAHFYNNLFACLASYLRMDQDSLVVGEPGQLSPFTLLAIFWLFGVVFLLATFYFMKVTAPGPAPSGGDGGGDAAGVVR